MSDVPAPPPPPAPAAAPVGPAGAHRPPLLRLAVVEWRKMLDTRASLWLLIITAIGVVGIAIAQAATATGSDAEAGAVFQTSCGIASILMPILAILLVTSEWSQRAGLITFALVPNRPRVIAAKFIAAVALVAFSLAVFLLLALVLGGGIGQGADITGTVIGQGALYLLMNVSIGFALGLVFMNSPLAIVLLFAAPIVISIVGAISTSINDVTVWLDQSELPDLISSTATIDWDRIGVTALVWIALPLVAGLIRLRRTDID